jgi:hypothetical protein
MQTVHHAVQNRPAINFVEGIERIPRESDDMFSSPSTYKPDQVVMEMIFYLRKGSIRTEALTPVPRRQTQHHGWIDAWMRLSEITYFSAQALNVLCHVPKTCSPISRTRFNAQQDQQYRFQAEDRKAYGKKRQKIELFLLCFAIGVTEVPWFHPGCAAVIVATKTDRPERDQLKKFTQLIYTGARSTSAVPVMPISCETRENKRQNLLFCRTVH